MKSEDIVLIIAFVLVLALLIWEIVYISQLKKGYFCEYNGHKIEFKMTFGKAFLYIDGVECDKDSTFFRFVVLLDGKIDEEKVELRMTTGLFRPIIKLYIGDNEFEMKKNEKVKKDKGDNK